MDVATDFAGQYGYLGILLEDSFGQVNYGYLQMRMDPFGSATHPAIYVDYVVYESTRTRRSPSPPCPSLGLRCC